MLRARHDSRTLSPAARPRALAAAAAAVLGFAAALLAGCSGPIGERPLPDSVDEIAVTGSRSGGPVPAGRAAPPAPASGAGVVAPVGAASAAAAPPGIASFRQGANAARAMSGPPLSRAEPGEELWVIATATPTSVAGPVEDDSPGSGTMLALLAPGSGQAQREIPLPLKRTDVHAAVTGYVGTVDVTQRFENPYDEKIEAVYLFPLPERAAVSEFVMTIGERKIRGILRAKEDAEQIYYEARAQGYRASLLVQRRPNIFEQKVANIEPRHGIDVSIRYYHTLAYEDGWYSFVFPTVVGPRYNPAGWSDPVAALPRDAAAPVSAGSAVRYLRPSERSAHDLSIVVDIDAGVAIEALDASHAVTARRDGATAHVELAGETTIPNRDFVLNFRVAGDTVKSNLLTYRDEATGQGYFTLMIYPPAGLERLHRQPLEMVFVLDTSGSMMGRPLEQAADAVRVALDHLEPTDTFQILNFSDRVSRLGSGPLVATPENLETARRYVAGLAAQGGTEMLNGIRAALQFPADPERMRFVTFLTDGYIGNEVQILAEVQQSIGRTRIFSFGVGNSVNRYLLDGLATEGRGAVAYLGLEDSAADVMQFFFDRISHPALTDLAIDWKGLDARELYPRRLPDLFVGRPIVVTGRYDGEPADVVISGRAAGSDVDVRVSAGSMAESGAAIRNLWARLRIADLASRQMKRVEPALELAVAIRETALEFGLMSEYTAFVAVDASERTAGQHGTTVYQAVPVPSGVRYDTTVAGDR